MFKRTMLCVAACATLSAAPFAQAATYYVNNWSLGDGNSGTTTSWPWKTVAKVNSNAVVSGDTVLFAAGGTWDETLIVKSGVTYGSYNSGNKPIIRGSRAVGGLTWTRTSPTSNIWWATTDASIETGAISQLYLNGARLPRARHPNIGQGAYGVNSRYLPVQSNGDALTLNLSNDPAQLSKLPIGTPMDGAKVYVRINNSELSQFDFSEWKSGGVNALKLSPISMFEGVIYWHAYDINAGWGYWLENKLWMLDSAGEWYFDAANHRLHVWMPNGASPQGQVLFAASQPGVVAVNASNFTVNNLEVRETVGDGISVKGGSNAKLTSININRPGARGIAMTGTTSNTISYVNVQDSVRDGIWLGDPRGTTAAISAINTTVVYNTVNNAGKGFHAHSAIMLGNGGLTSNNVVTNSSYIGILASKPATIQNNLVKNSCLDFEDCGGIYLGGLANGEVLNSTVQNNIVDGGSGSADGSAGSVGDARGIYLDDFVNTATVSGNFVTGMKHGFMLHSAKNITLTQNTAFKNRDQGLLMQEEQAGAMVNNLITNNLFLSIGLNYPNILQVSNGGTGTNGNFATYNQNSYVALNSPEQSLLHNYVKSGSTVLLAQNFTLSAWQQATGQDLGSSFRVLSQDSEAAFGFYNPTGAADTTVSCPSAIQARCAAYVNLKTNLPVTFPISLPTNSFVVIGR